MQRRISSKWLFQVHQGVQLLLRRKLIVWCMSWHIELDERQNMTAHLSGGTYGCFFSRDEVHCSVVCDNCSWWVDWNWEPLWVLTLERQLGICWMNAEKQVVKQVVISPREGLQWQILRFLIFFLQKVMCNWRRSFLLPQPPRLK